MQSPLPLRERARERGINSNMPHYSYKYATLITIVIFIMAILILQPPIETPIRYTILADHRSWLAIPNAWNVLSNLPFMLVAIWALYKLFQPSHRTPIIFNDPKEKFFYLVFFIGIFFVSLSSSYYHWAPNNLALMWDRVPIAIAMTAFLSAIIAERINLHFARFMIWPLLILAVFSVFYWYFTVEQGREDLRLYALVVVFFPIIIPFILWMFKAPYTQVKYLWFTLIAFLIARIFEAYDQAIYIFTAGIVSGHSLKHLFLALSCFLIYLYIRKRKSVGSV